jgi:hypothetical protein
VRIIYTIGACCTPPATPTGITGVTNPCVGESRVYSVTSAEATNFIWEFPAGWVITNGAGTNTVTVTVGVGGGAIAVSPSNSCETLTPTILNLNLCSAPSANIVYNTAGTYTYTVPDCVTSIFVEAWGGGGGGGACTSNQNSGGEEACTGGGGGGGGGYASRSYSVTPGQTYTVVVGAGGVGGTAVATNLSNTAANIVTASTANNGGDGGASTFSGPATVATGTLTALGGLKGGGAWSRNQGNGSHIGTDGAGGAGSGGLNGTVMYTGGAGTSGRHSGSCYDVSGAGGGGAGTTSVGGIATSPASCTLRTGGTGGSSDGGNGANGRILSAYGVSRQANAGVAGSPRGGGGGGAMIHLNNWPNTFTLANGGVGGVGEVRITQSACPLPIELISFDGECIDDMLQFSWATASEVNNDFFTVEESSNGIDFYPLIVHDGAGNSNTVQQYGTAIKSLKTQAYYRLRQTDFDGGTDVSETIFVDCKKQEKEIVLQPNPAKDRVELTFYGFEKGKYEIQVYDLLGRKVIHDELLLNGTYSYTLDINNLAVGNFIVKVYDGENEIIKRFTKASN